MDKNNKFVMILLVTTILFTIAQLTKNDYLFAVVMPILIFTWVFAGAARNGKVAPVQTIWWVISLVIMIGSLIGMLNISSVPENITKSHLFGYPLPTGIMFFVYWILLAITSTVSFSVRFDKDHLKKDWIREFEEKTGAKILPSSNDKKKGAEVNESTISR